MKSEKEINEVIQIYEIIQDSLYMEGIKETRLRPYIKLLKWVLEK